MSLIKYILCLIGLHSWEYGDKPLGLRDARTGRIMNEIYEHRTCKHCGCEQFYTKRTSFMGSSDNKWLNK